MALTERLAILISASAGGAVREFNQLSGAAGKTDKSLSKASIAAGAMKGALGAIGFTAAVSGMSAMVKGAIDWETAWTGVTKTVEGTPEQLAALESGLRELARTLPSSHEEIAAVAEAAGQLGVEVDNVEGFTKTMIDLGETTNLSANEAATALARFMNVMGTSQGEVSNLGSAVVELGNNFETTEAELVNMAQRISGAGAQIGLTEGDVLGLATALSSVGIEAEAGGTAISRVMIDIAKAVDTGNDKLELFAAVAGQSAEQFSVTFREDAGAALTAFIEGLGNVVQAGGSITPILEELGQSNIRVSDTLRRAAQDSAGFSEALRTGNDAYAENMALAEEADKRYGTMASRLEVAGNKAKDAAIEFGTPLAEALTDVAEFAGDATAGINDFNDALRQATEGSNLQGGEGYDLFYNIFDLFGDLGEVAKTLGIAMSQGTEAADAYWASLGQGADAVAAAGEAYGPTIEESERYAASLEGVGQAYGPTIEESEAWAAVLATGADTAEEAQEAIEELAESISGLGGRFRDTQAAQDAVSESINNLMQPVKDLRKAQRELAAATDDESRAKAEQAVAEAQAALALDGNSEAALDNRDNLRDLAEQALDSAVQMLELGGSTDDAKREIQRARDAVIDARTAMGDGKAEARRYADQLGLIPGDVETTIEQPGMDDALSKVSTYQGFLNNIPRSVRTSIEQHYYTTGTRVAGITGQGGFTLADGGWAGDRPPGFPGGGWVSGPGSSRSDSILARLSNGEFVVNAQSAQAYAPLLEAINKGDRLATMSARDVTVNVYGTTEQVVQQVTQRLRYEQALARTVV